MLLRGSFQKRDHLLLLQHKGKGEGRMAEVTKKSCDSNSVKLAG